MMTKLFVPPLLLQLLLLSLVVPAIAPQRAQAQTGSTQVTIVGVPPILPSPSIDDLLDEYDRGAYQFTVLFTSASTAPVPFRLSISLQRNGITAFTVESLPVDLSPGVYTFSRIPDGPGFIFDLSAKDILNLFVDGIDDKIFRTHLLPEGDYLLQAELIPENPSATIANAPAMVPFSVRYPQPPVLFTPTELATVNQQFPVFSWTPVTVANPATIVYDFLLVELLENQTPLEAIEGNRPHLELSLDGQTVVQYGPRFLPLEDGRTYAWQVRSRDPINDTPFNEDGYTEIRTFTFNPSAAPESLRNLKQIVLEPGFAVLQNFARLDVETTPSSYVLSGDAELLLDGDRPTRTRVRLNRLEIQNTNLQDPVLLSGGVSALRRPINLGFRMPDIVSVGSLGWQFGSGFTLRGGLQLPDGRDLPAAGQIRLSAAGLQGMLTASDQDLFAASDDYVKVAVNEVSVSLPDGRMSGAGEATLFGEAMCSLDAFRFSDGAISAPVSCNSEDVIPLAGAANEFSLSLNRVTGAVSFDEQGLQYDLTASTGINLETVNPVTTDSDFCGLQAFVKLSSERGLGVDEWYSSCTDPSPVLDLGLFQASLMRLDVAAFDYSASGWTVELATDLQLSSPYLGDLRLPSIPGARITRDGIQIPEAHFDASRVRTTMALGPLRLLFKQIDFPESRFAWFDWDKVGPGPWDFGYTAAIRFPDNNTQPDCVRGSEMEVIGFYNEREGMGAGVRSEGVRDCRIPIGRTGTAIVSDELSVEFGSFANFDPNAFEKFEIGFELRGDGRIEYGAPFTCEDGSDNVGAFSFAPASGGIDLALDRFVPSCGLNIGPFAASVTQSQLRLEAMQGEQFGWLSGTGRIEFSRSNFTEGTFELNLATGEFSDVNFALESAFTFAIPRDEPVFEFRVDRARLDADGLMITGRQSLIAGNQSIGVTFARAVLDLEQGRVRSGRIRFDDSFALGGGVEAADSQLKFKALPIGSAPPFDPGFALDLAASAIIDSAGFHYGGSVDGRLNFDGTQYDSDLRAEFTDDFELDTHPPSIGSGQVDLYWKETRIAFADAAGLHPAIADIASELLPDLLPLPDVTVAYLRLKEGEEDLVSFGDLGSGRYSINSAGAGPVLVVPALNPSTPPEFANVELDDVVVRASGEGFAFESGSIAVSQAADAPADWPIAIDRIAFEDRDANTALYVDGNLRVFGQDLGGSARLSLYVSSAGASGQVDVSDVAVRIPLVGESEVVSLGITGITGTINTAGTTRLDLDSRIELVSGDDVATGASLGLRWDGSTMVATSFDFDGVGGGSIDVGPLSFQFDGIESVSGLSYSDVGGWLFDIALDAQLAVNLPGDRRLVIPLRGLAATPAGLVIPAQDINDGTIPGLDLPPVAVAGISIKAFALRTANPATIDWYSGDLASVNTSAIQPSIDFSVRVPSLAQSGLMPPDGLSVYGASIVDGLIEGTLETFAPSSDVTIPLVASLDSGPEVSVSEIAGSFSASPQRTQLISIDLMASLRRLGVLDDEGDCSPSAPFRLQLIDGLYFQGSVQNYQPCGSYTLGPGKLSFGSSSVDVLFTPDDQQLTLEGSASVTLPGPTNGPPVTASGSVGVDVLNGELTSGSIAINDPFTFGFPFNAENPQFRFGASQALLDASGFTVSGTGDLNVGGASADVQYSNLSLAFPDVCKSGKAIISPSVDFNIGLSPLGWSFVQANAPEPSDNYVRMNLSGGIELNQTGLAFTGSASANLVFAANPFAALAVEFGGGFALRPGAFNVNQGYANFFTADEPDEPIATIDENGFRIGGGITALLPAKLGLPTEDVAYLVLRDDQGSPLVDAVNTGNGWTLTSDNPLSLVLAGLEDDQGNAPTFDVDFDLATDAAYNVQSGSVSLASPVDLEPELGIPLSLETLSVESNSAVSLIAGLSVDLPKALGEHELTATAALTSSGFDAVEVELGAFETSYNPNAQPISEYTFSSGAASDATTFGFALQGVRVRLGSNPALAVAATATSSVLTVNNEPAFFFSGSFSNGAWNLDIDPVGVDETIPLGVARLRPLGANPFGLTLDDTRFELSIDGELSFEELLGEDFNIQIQDLLVGVRDVDTAPRVVLELASASLPDQNFELFEGAVELAISSPTLGISDGKISVAATGGTMGFANMDVGFSALSFDTDGGFDLSGVQLNNAEILGGLASLSTVGLGFVNGSLRLDAGIDVSLPDPIDTDVQATVAIYRDAQGRVKVDADMPAVELEGEYALGSFGKFKLTKAIVDIDPFDPLASGIFANGEVEINDEPIVWFGSTSNFPDEAGISYTETKGLQYNVSGNVAFDLETSFFEIAVEGNAVASSGKSFEMEFGGDASVMIEGVGGSVGYEGFLVNADGVADAGRLVPPAEFTLLDIMTLSVGGFEYTSSENGVQITIADGFGQGIEDVQARAGQQAPTRQVTVTEYLCFGKCGSSSSDVSLTVGGSSDTENGIFSGGVDEVLFYKTTDGATYMHIDNFHLELSDAFRMSASLQYANTSSGVELRAVGGGEFDVGGVQAQASLAGSFSTTNSKPSFGLFVAVASSVGIPIVPGVIELTGAGGGFFLNPRQSDLNLVTGPNGALAAFGHDLVNPASVPDAQGVDFAAMLFAQAGVGGSAGNYVVKGSAFLQLTNRSVLIDTRGTVLGLDGNGVANAKLEAGLSIAATTKPFTLDGNVVVDVDIPIYASGGMDLNLFMVERNSDILWGIIGEGELKLINDLFTAEGSFAAADIGFLLEAGIKFEFDIPIISFNAAAEGFVWLINDEQFPMPFGAYAVVWARVCVDLLLDEACAGADLRAAIVKKRPSGFEMFAAIGVEITAVGTVRAWASASEDGVRFGFGKGAHGDLIDQAKQQAEDFKDYVRSLADEIDAARQEMNKPPDPPVVDDAVATAAGFRYHTLRKSNRDRVGEDIVENEPSSLSSYAGMKFVADSLLFGDSPGPDPLEGNARYAHVFDARDEAEAFEENAVAVADLVSPRLRQAELEAIDFQSDASAALDGFYGSLNESPVTASNMGQSGPNPVEPSFTIDTGAAAAIDAQSSGLANAVAARADETIRAIDTITNNLSRIHSLMALQLQINLTYDPLSGDVSGGSASSEPSVNDMMSAFAAAETAFDRYYAEYVNYFWSGRGWSLRMRDKLRTRQSTIQQNLTGMYGAETDRASRIATSGNRVGLLTSISQTGSPSAAHDAHVAALNNQPDTGVQQAYVLNGMQLWYGMHYGGLDTLGSVLGSSAIDVLTAKRSRIKPLIDAHAEATRTMERVYELRADISAMQYTLVDNLLRQDAEGQFLADTTRMRMAALKDRLVKALQPPDVTGISVQSVRHGYVNESTLGIGVQHPLSVAELSVQFEQSTTDNGSIDLSAFRSIGKTSTLPFVANRTGYSRDGSNEAFHDTKQFTVRVRARGPAGHTNTRSADFTVAVGPGSSYSGGDDDDILVVDTTPPEKPLIFLELDYANTTQTLLDENLNPIQVKRYWSHDPNKIDLLVSSRDIESDISGFEYAVGTSRTSTDVIGWTPLQGSRFVDSGADGKPAVFMDAATALFTLERGRPYYVSIRSTNGEGLVSSVAHSDAVVLDDTPPTDPSPLFVVPTIFLPLYFPPDVHAPVTSVPTYYRKPPSEIEQDIRNAALPSVTLKWNESEDTESGVDVYEYVLDNGSEPQFSSHVSVSAPEKKYAAYGAPLLGEQLLARFNGRPSSYTDRVQLYVRARNHAGLTSNALTVSALPKDPTGPVGLDARVRVRVDALDIFLTNAVFDHESGVAGIEYSVGTTAGGTDVRGWPNQVDFEWSNGLSLFQSTSAAPAFQVAANSLPQGEVLYVNVRAKNNQGIAGNVVSAGPIVLDTSPPLTPSIKLSKSGANLKIEVTGMQDPESGLAKIEYRVADRFDILHPGVWKTFRFVSGTPTYAIDYTRTEDVSAITSLGNAKVSIRLTNGNGLQTVASAVMPVQVNF